MRLVTTLSPSDAPAKKRKLLDYNYVIPPEEWPTEMFFRDMEFENPRLLEIPYYQQLRASFREKSDTSERLPLIDVAGALSPRYRKKYSVTPDIPESSQKTRLSSVLLDIRSIYPVLPQNMGSTKGGWRALGETGNGALRFVRGNDGVSFSCMVADGSVTTTPLCNLFVLRYDPLIIARWIDPYSDLYEIIDYRTPNEPVYVRADKSLPVPLGAAPTWHTNQNPPVASDHEIRYGYVSVPNNHPMLAEIFRERRSRVALLEYLKLERNSTRPITETDMEAVASNSGISIADLAGMIRERRDRMDHRMAMWKQRGENQFIFRTKYANDRAETIISRIVDEFTAQIALVRKGENEGKGSTETHA